MHKFPCFWNTTFIKVVHLIDSMHDHCLYGEQGCANRPFPSSLKISIHFNRAIAVQLNVPQILRRAGSTKYWRFAQVKEYLFHATLPICLLQTCQRKHKPHQWSKITVLWQDIGYCFDFFHRTAVIHHNFRYIMICCQINISVLDVVFAWEILTHEVRESIRNGWRLLIRATFKQLFLSDINTSSTLAP